MKKKLLLNLIGCLLLLCPGKAGAAEESLYFNDIWDSSWSRFDWHLGPLPAQSPDLSAMAATYKSDYINPVFWSADRSGLRESPGGIPIKAALASKMNEFGGEPGQTYNYLVQSLKAQKNSPENVRDMVNSLLAFFDTQYDWDSLASLDFKKVAGTNAEVLAKFLQTPDNSPTRYALCMQMHEFIMKLLNDAGIKAVVLTGSLEMKGIFGSDSGGGFHTTVLFQLEDGRYVWNNYGRSIIIDAGNIIQASRIVMGRSENFTTLGLIYIQGAQPNATFCAYAITPETLFGAEIDKNSDLNLAKTSNDAFSYRKYVNALSDFGLMDRQSQWSASVNYENGFPILKVNNESISPDSRSAGLTTCEFGSKEIYSTEIADVAVDNALNISHTYIRGGHLCDLDLEFNYTQISAQTMIGKTRYINIGTILAKCDYKYFFPPFFDGLPTQFWMGCGIHPVGTFSHSEHNGVASNFIGWDLRKKLGVGLVSEYETSNSDTLRVALSHEWVFDMAFNNISELVLTDNVGTQDDLALESNSPASARPARKTGLYLTMLDIPGIYHKTLGNLKLEYNWRQFLGYKNTDFKIEGCCHCAAETLDIPSFRQDLGNGIQILFNADWILNVAPQSVIDLGITNRYCQDTGAAGGQSLFYVTLKYRRAF